jgi:hypothetical protein
MLTRVSALSCFSFCILLLLTGCNKDEENIGRYGMLDKNTPEYAAVAFMRSIYEDRNIDKAVALSTPSLGRILQSYHSNRNVQRNVLNLRYDTVKITPQSSQSVGRTEYAEKATLTLFFSGFYQGNKVEDLRTLELIKEGGGWKVTKIYPDQFL